MRTVKIIVEKHPDGYVAYPLGMRGACVGEGDSYEEAVADASSAIRTHIDVFGFEAFDDGSEAEAVFVAETRIPA